MFFQKLPWANALFQGLQIGRKPFRTTPSSVSAASSTERRRGKRGKIDCLIFHCTFRKLFCFLSWFYEFQFLIIYMHFFSYDFGQVGTNCTKLTFWFWPHSTIRESPRSPKYFPNNLYAPGKFTRVTLVTHFWVESIQKVPTD